MGDAAESAALVGEVQATSRETLVRFRELGYVKPFRLLSAAECLRFLEATEELKKSARGWEKECAVHSRAFFEIASHPLLRELLTTVLGDDVMLWGASIVSRVPGEVHPWHSDIESSAAGAGKTASAWIGLQNTTADSSLQLIPGSHRFDTTIQEMRYRMGKDRAGTTSEDILAWARQRDANCEIVKTEMVDGDALLFDGQIWHGSRNLSGETRSALLLQYSTPDVKIRIPDLNHLDWPFRYRRFAKPRCVMISGKSRRRVNRIVAARRTTTNLDSGNQLTSRVCPLQLPLAPDHEKGWKPYAILEGRTAGLEYLSCHVSVLSQGRCPHPPHKHNEEELLLLLDGEADLILPSEKGITGNERRRVKAGSFVYYPAQFGHTIEAASKDPATYMMFKWHSGTSDALRQLQFGEFNFGQFATTGALPGGEPGDGFGLRVLFEGPTAYLQNLHCHFSTVAPGGGYETHVDSYDVAAIVLSGQVETLGQRAAPHSVVFYRGGEAHGLRNPTDALARYLVFEFHGAGSGGVRDSLLSKIIDRRRVRRKLKRLARGFLKR